MTPPRIKYLRFEDLCAKLGGRSRSSVYRDLEHGRLPEPIRIGARPLWIEDEVDEFLRAQRADADRS